jgi:hypothetical protein
MNSKITVRVSVPDRLTPRILHVQFIKLCAHFECIAQHDDDHNSWNIETSDPVNLLWLGANMFMELPRGPVYPSTGTAEPAKPSEA